MRLLVSFGSFLRVAKVPALFRQVSKLFCRRYPKPLFWGQGTYYRVARGFKECMTRTRGKYMPKHNVIAFNSCTVHVAAYVLSRIVHVDIVSVSIRAGPPRMRTGLLRRDFGA